MFNTAQMIIEEQKPNNSTETAILPMQCCAFVLFYYFSIKNLFNSRYLRCVGKQWSCPAYILPLFFETPDERVTPRNLLDSVECPMRGNNWTPARPDGVERHTFFTLNLPSIILCRFRMTHNVFGLGEVAEPEAKLEHKT